MSIVISYLPWIVFLAGPELAGIRASAVAAIVFSVLIMVPDIRRTGRPKLMDVKGAAFFGCFVAAAFVFPKNDVTFWAAPLGSLALALFAAATVAAGRPFTQPYAEQMTDPAVQDTPVFRRAVRDIALGWTAGFTVMAAGAWLEAFGGIAHAETAGTILGLGGAALFQIIYRMRLPAA